MNTTEVLFPADSSPPVWPLANDDRLAYYVRHILAERPCGLCTDIDGTISEIAPTVDAAVLFPGMRELLLQATERFDLVATISGRGVEDQRRMIDVSHVWHVGHHGYEWEELQADGIGRCIRLLPGAEPYLMEVAAALDEIETELAPRVPGVWMERKGITGGIHWRLATDHKAADLICSPIIRRIAASHGLRTRRSKLAVEIFPPISTNKGEGLRRLITFHSLKSVIYLGDDVSDTDAFRTLRSLRNARLCQGIAIGVLRESSSPLLEKTADLLVHTVEDVYDVLSWLHKESG